MKSLSYLLTTALPTWEISVPYHVEHEHTQHSIHSKWIKNVIAIIGTFPIIRVDGDSCLLTNPALPASRAKRAVQITCSEEDILKIINMTISHYDEENVVVSMLNQKSIVLAKSDFENREALYVIWFCSIGHENETWNMVSIPIIYAEAERVWNSLTDNGTCNVRFNNTGCYYSIFPENDTPRFNPEV